MARTKIIDEQPAMAGMANKSYGLTTEESVENRVIDEARSIISRLSLLAKEQVNAKLEIEKRWIRNLRAIRGKYDGTTETQLKERNQSRAFVKLPRAKAATLEARLFDMLFPTDDRNWGIEATPVPILSKEIQSAKKRISKLTDQANVAEENKDTQQLLKATNDVEIEGAKIQAAESEIETAKQAADRMQNEIEDQLVECKYPSEARDVIRNSCRLGTGVLKGPIVNNSGRGRWLPGEDGSYNLEIVSENKPMVSSRDPWSFFPDMSARTIEEAEFTFERYLWTKRDLRKMVKTHGFNKDAVRRIISMDSGSFVDVGGELNYLTQLREMEGGTVDMKNRFLGWEYHGELTHDEVVCLLRAMGAEEVAEEYQENEDPLREFRVVVFFCNNEVLKISPEYPLDSGETLYSVFNIEEDEVSMFGYGIPEIMADTANSVNSAWRMALDNSAFSVGPQVVVDESRIRPADGEWIMAPRKVWKIVSSQTPASSQAPMDFFNVPNNMEQIAAIIKIALEFIDMETGISMPLQGEQGNVTQTVGGMAILQNASNIIFRRIVKNFDDQVTTPMIRRMYDWNMQFNPKEDIKGDMAIDARGSSVLLVKEIQAQNLLFVIMSLLNNPTTANMIKSYEAVQKLFQSMMISSEDLMVTKERWEELVQQQAEAQSQQQDPNIINAQSRIEVANIQSDTRERVAEVMLMIAQLRERTQLMEAAQSGQITREQLQNRLAEIREKEQAADRRMAAEIGAEKMAAEEARAAGREPTGSGGFISLGTSEGNNG